jgi:hypothetical protein
MRPPRSGIDVGHEEMLAFDDNIAETLPRVAAPVIIG